MRGIGKNEERNEGRKVQTRSGGGRGKGEGGLFLEFPLSKIGVYI